MFKIVIPTDKPVVKFTNEVREMMEMKCAWDFSVSPVLLKAEPCGLDDEEMKTIRDRYPNAPELGG